MQEDAANTELVKLRPNDYILMPRGGMQVFTSQECDRIIQMSSDFPLVTGETVRDGDRQQNKELRQSEIKWLNQNDSTQWVYDKVSKVIGLVNNDYNFAITGIEPMQIAQYTDSGFYGWHADTGKGITSLRKLSLSIELSDPDEFEGGNLEFQGMSLEGQPKKSKGSAVVFPSFLYHRVTPVTRGTRWSIVAWIVGPPFR